MFEALRDWISDMRWTTGQGAGSVQSNAELAVDSEVHTGIDLRNLGDRTGPAPVNDRHCDQQPRTDAGQCLQVREGLQGDQLAEG